MNTPQQTAKFFQFWVDACAQRHNILLQDWTNYRAFTSHVLTEPDPIIKAVATSLDLQWYSGYYHIDAILFRDADRVPDAPAGTTWVRRIRVAFEHENNFDSGLFQEVSHLLITDCDLRVVVSYPNNPDELASQLKYLYSIIADTDRSDQIAETGAFLFIAGRRDITEHTIEWSGYVYERTEWRKLWSYVVAPTT